MMMKIREGEGMSKCSPPLWASLGTGLGYNLIVVASENLNMEYKYMHFA